jgi:hypothetical protein
MFKWFTMFHSFARAFVLLALPMASLNAQVPYGDFESWDTTDSLFENPHQWSSLNEIHHLLGYTEYTIQRVPSEVDGLYALQAQTRKFCDADSSICYLVPGMAVLGELYVNPSDLSLVTPGLPYTERPEFLTAYYQYYPVLQDSFRVVAELSKSLEGGGKMVIAYGEFQNGTVVEQFQPMNLELVYFSNAIPDKIRVAIYSGVRNEPYSGDYPEGSRLILDKVELGPKIESPTAILDPVWPAASIQVYPVPASTSLNWQVQGQGGAMALSVQLYDNTGRLLKQDFTASQQQTASGSLSLTDLPDGTYWLRFSGPKGEHLGTRQIPVIR